MFVFGTAGHVDHGKSSFLKRLTGLEPDRLPEEKKRGMTIELNFVWVDLSGNRVGIIDVPGHKRFVKNMILGTSSIDAFIFVLASDDGWMPQSEEHLEVLRVLGVKNGLGILSKVDLVSSDRALEVKNVFKKKLSETFQKEIEVCSFSLESDLGEIKRNLHKIVETLPHPRNIETPRIWIDRVFTPKGQGVVVTGTLREGTIRTGDEVSLSPIDKKAIIKSIQVHQSNVLEVHPVSRVAIQLGRISNHELSRGILIQKNRETPKVDRFDAKLSLWLKPSKNIHLYFHLGSAREKAFVMPMGGDSSFVRIKLASPLPLRIGDRFLLRTEGEEKTVGGGVIVDPLPRSGSNREALSHLKNWIETIEGILSHQMEKTDGISLETIFKVSLFSREEILKELRSDRYLEINKSFFVDRNIFRLSKERSLDFLKKENSQTPELSLRSLGISKPMLDGCLQELISEGLVEKNERGYIVKSKKEEIKSQESKGDTEICERFRKHALPLSIKELANPALRSVLYRLSKEKKLVALGEEHFLSPESFEGIKTKVLQYLKVKGSATTSELKEHLKLSRKHAVFILEKLDELKFTYLKDNVRKLFRA